MVDNSKKGRRSRRKIPVTEGLTSKEILYCELVARGEDKVKAYKTAFKSRGSEEYMQGKADELEARVDIREELERQRELAGDIEAIDGVTQEEQLTDINVVNIKKIDDISDIAGEEGIKWSQGIAFNRLKNLLDGCESATQLLKERPKLFSECRDLIKEVKEILSGNGMNTRNTARLSELIDCMENIEDITYKLSRFSIKEFNSTVYTANALMREMNNLTGVKKNATNLKNESFEDKVFRLLSEANSKNNKTNSFVEDIEEYAFSEEED